MFQCGVVVDIKRYFKIAFKNDTLNLKLQRSTTRDFQAVSHQSTNPARHCLTSVIKQEPVLSVWCGLNFSDQMRTGAFSVVCK